MNMPGIAALDRTQRKALLLKVCCCVLAVFTGPTLSAADALMTSPMITDFSNQAGWWTPLDVASGGVYFAFNAPGLRANAAQTYCDDKSDHEVMIGKKLGADAVVTGVLRHADGSVWVQHDDCGHYAPSIAVDGDGYIHVWADQRSNPDGWQYFRSAKPFDVSDIRRSTGIDGLLPAVDRVTGVRATYPIARTAPNGDVYVMVSRQLNKVNKAGRATEPFKRALALLRWDRKTWSVVDATVATADLPGAGPDAGIYPDDLQIDSRGGVHMIFSWAVGNDSVRHYGSYLRFDPAAEVRHFFTADGKAVATPVHYRNTAGLVYQGLQKGESFKDCDKGEDGCLAGLQTAKLTLIPEARAVPSIAYRMRVPGEKEFAVFHTFGTTLGWTAKTRVTRKAGVETTAALGHTNDGARVRVYYATRDQGLYVADNSDDWKTPVPILGGKKIKQIAVVSQDSGVDVVYAQEIDPRKIGINEGRLYLVERPWGRQGASTAK